MYNSINNPVQNLPEQQKSAENNSVQNLPDQQSQQAQPSQQNQTQQSQPISGSDAIIRSLESLGVDTIFGLPGGAILPTYHAITASSKFEHILVRHEQAAGHAASGYALATGKVGVAMVTSGPAATNVVTAIADANMDSVPIVVITGQVGKGFIGTDAFQEADIVGITLPITKHSFLLTDADDIARVFTEAFHIASTGRPGPVLIDISKTAMVGKTNWSWPVKMDLPGYQPSRDDNCECVTNNAIGGSCKTEFMQKISQAVALIKDAKRPTLYVGGGAMRSHATAELTKLVETLGIPAVTTLQARGILPDSHPLNYGFVGMHGSIAAMQALQDSDLLISLGARFSDRVTGALGDFAQGAKIIQIDIDKAELSKNLPATIEINSDITAALIQLNTHEGLQAGAAAKGVTKYDEWVKTLNQTNTKYPIDYRFPEISGKFEGSNPTTNSTDSHEHIIFDEDKSKINEALCPQNSIEVFAALVQAENNKTNTDTVFVSGVGQHQMWASQLIKFEKPDTWINSAGLGTMGYAIPAAMGAKKGEPNKIVWAVDGDGCFQMTNQELATCRLYGINIKVALINNSTLGMPRQWQSLFFDEHYSETDLHDGPGAQPPVPNYELLTKAYDCAYFKITEESQIESIIKEANAINDRPVVVEFIVKKDALVWPMVAAGASNNEIMYGPNVKPLKK
jgi:acetolactate synthase-1/2/3 large subunit